MQALLFDMDGVVVDSEDYWHTVERDEILPAMVEGATPSLDEITGMPYREIYAHLARDYDVTVSEAEFVARYDTEAERIYGEQVVLLDGFEAIQREAEDAGVPVAIVSSSPPHWLDVVQDRFGLSFDLVLSADDIDGPGKPAPDIYEEAARRLGVGVADCVVVEDSENGAQAGATAGAFVVGFRTSHNRETDLSMCDVVVESPAELRDELRGRLETQE
jgi:HAD superfamily hydrolase (TIGR01509 family)